MTTVNKRFAGRFRYHPYLDATDSDKITEPLAEEIEGLVDSFENLQVITEIEFNYGTDDRVLVLYWQAGGDWENPLKFYLLYRDTELFLHVPEDQDRHPNLREFNDSMRDLIGGSENTSKKAMVVRTATRLATGKIEAKHFLDL
jgi:hypothetical protein